MIEIVEKEGGLGLWRDRDNGEGELRGFQIIETFEIGLVSNISNRGVHLMFAVFEIIE